MRVVKWVAGVAVVLLVLGGGVAWWQREGLTAWWVVRGLKQAEGAARQVWFDRAIGLGDAAVGPLVGCLITEQGHDPAVENALDALNGLARAGHAARVAERLVKAFPKLGAGPRVELLRRMPEWGDDARPACVKLLLEAAGQPEPEVQEAGVDLAAALAGQAGEENLAAVREMARAGLRAAKAEVRLKAVRLCLQPGVEMLDQVVALLRDPSPEVRRAAVLAVGPAEQVVRDDLLLAGLHDADEEVRRLTEASLRGRGLRPEHLELGRLLTHPTPASRLQVLDRVRDMLDDAQGDLDPGVWLRRLSHDHSPAVRAAALRMMSQQSVIDLSDRVDQMARSDPSPTVTQLAQFYQKRKR
jgi:hypothetical protein